MGQTAQLIMCETKNGKVSGLILGKQGGYLQVLSKSSVEGWFFAVRSFQEHKVERLLLLLLFPWNAGLGSRVNVLRSISSGPHW